MTPLLEQVYASGDFRRQGHALVDRLADYLEACPTLPANPLVAPEDLLATFRALLSNKTKPEDLYELMLRHSLHLHAPTYMGHQVNPPAPLTALGDLLNGIINGSTAIYEMGSTGAVMERLVMETFANMLGLSSLTGGFMTNGGTLANLTALLAARATQWPEGDAWQAGNGHLRPCVLVNEQAHYCIDRAVRIMGWGEEGIINVPSDEAYKMKTEQLDELIAGAREKGLTPLAIIGSAGTTSTGSFDDLASIADVAERHNLWFHVDGAHGGALYLDPDRRELVRGMDRADSLIVDFHKTMMTPGLTTGVFFKDGSDAYRTFHQKAEYLLSFDSGEEDWANMGRRTFECTKNMMSLRVFSLLSVYGPEVFRDYLTSVNSIAARCAAAVRQTPELELAVPPETNIVCFRYHPKTKGLTVEEVNGLNQMIRAQIIQETDFYIVQTKLRGLVWLRCTFTNPMTSEEHIDKMLQEVKARGQALVGLRSGMPMF